jgi:8-oxo-dGTP pyrophosphatase MutT (NUDIX family)
VITSHRNLFEPVIEAAGGIVWREMDGEEKLAIIHRPNLDDWVIPKGKRDPGESWQDTALREVFEETACKAELMDFSGSVAYTVRGVAKVVLFWHMQLHEEGIFQPNAEVDAIRWLTPEEAIAMLSYENEKKLLVV